MAADARRMFKPEHKTTPACTVFGLHIIILPYSDPRAQPRHPSGEVYSVAPPPKNEQSHSSHRMLLAPVHHSPHQVTRGSSDAVDPTPTDMDAQVYPFPTHC